MSAALLVPFTDKPYQSRPRIILGSVGVISFVGCVRAKAKRTILGATRTKLMVRYATAARPLQQLTSRMNGRNSALFLVPSPPFRRDGGEG